MRVKRALGGFFQSAVVHHEKDHSEGKVPRQCLFASVFLDGAGNQTWSYQRQTSMKNDGRFHFPIRPFLLAVVSAAVLAAGALSGFGRVAASAQSPKVVRPILSATFLGGFAPQGYDIGQSAQYLVTSDRILYRPGAVIAIFPGPALYPLTQELLTKKEIANLDKLAKTAGLQSKAVNWGNPPTADVPTLTLTWRGKSHSIPSFGVGEESLTKGQRASRAAVGKLLKSLDRPYGKLVTPTAVVIVPFGVREGDSSIDGVKPTLVDWPAGVTPLGDFGGGCRVLEGAEGIAAAQFISKQNSITQYRSGGQLYRIAARIFIPGDRGCTN
jgi:hypothetical protein